MCRALGLSRSGHHAFRTREPSQRALDNPRLDVLVAAIFAELQGGALTQGCRLDRGRSARRGPLHRSPALGLRQTPPSAWTLIFHSDRGVEFAAHRFRAPLARACGLQSMSHKGDCWKIKSRRWMAPGEGPVQGFGGETRVEPVAHVPADKHSAQLRRSRVSRWGLCAAEQSAQASLATRLGDPVLDAASLRGRGAGVGKPAPTLPAVRQAGRRAGGAHRLCEHARAECRG